MVNEEIITGLRNAVEHGENLYDAMQIMMNSGYPPQEVQEASRYVSGGTLHMQQPTPEEHLTMPDQKSRLLRMAFWKNQQTSQPKITQQSTIQQNQVQQIQKPMQQPIQKPQPIQQIQQNSQPAEQFQVQQAQQPKIQQSSVPLTKQLEKIGPRKPSHIKEITLLIVLLILIAVLIATILFKNTILGWFS